MKNRWQQLIFIVLLVCLPSISAYADNLASKRVVIIGIDGMTYQVLNPLIDSGRLPTLARLINKSARAILLSEKPMRSPALWATIATGQPRKIHGIYDFITGSPYWPSSLRHKEQQLVTSDMRHAEALWQFTSDAGMQNLVVGWLNTWPAESLLGVMVSPYQALNPKKRSNIKGRIVSYARDQVFPAAVFEDIRPLIVDPRSVSAKTLARVLDAPPTHSSIYKKAKVLHRYIYSTRYSIASAETNTKIIESLLAKYPNTQLVMTYFDGIDTIGHRFWIMREPLATLQARLNAHNIDPAIAVELKSRFGHAVEGLYELVDGLIARIEKAAGPNATIIMVSDHGWGLSPGIAANFKNVPFDGEHKLDGVFIASGPYIKKGQYKVLTQYDVAPTVLRLLGITPPSLLPGRVISELIDLDGLGPAKINAIASRTNRAEVKSPTQPTTVKPDFTDEEFERLRSLGYIK
ncbi:MAG: alkaline phosphatase family protein [Deltaproteobacteria bacterium]|nr:alkaline phosphatase family protein [Deltaproteobacteria bacterium]